MNVNLPGQSDRETPLDQVRIGDYVAVRRVAADVVEVSKLAEDETPESSSFPVLQLVVGDSPNTAILRQLREEP